MTTNLPSEEPTGPIISNQSGGIDIDADKVKIGGDAIARDKIVSDKSIKVGNIEHVTGLAIGDGASITIVNPSGTPSSQPSGGCLS